MSRLVTLFIALTLLTALGWAMSPFEAPAYAATLDAWLSEHIAQVLFKWFGDWHGDGFETDRPTFSYTLTLLGIASIAAAAAIGFIAGSMLRKSEFRAREEDLKRQLFETKGRIPQLETSVRNRELAVTRLKMEIDEWQARVEAMNRAIHDREQTLRDRDRNISKLTSEVAVMKAMSIGNDAGAEAARVAFFAADKSEDAATSEGELKPRLSELETALETHQRRLSAAERERERQDRWLEVLNDQLARARQENDRLLAGSSEIEQARRRISELEAEVLGLRQELAERDRRLAASRFECANARTTVAYLQAELARRGDDPARNALPH